MAGHSDNNVDPPLLEALRSEVSECLRALDHCISRRQLQPSRNSPRVLRGSHDRASVTPSPSPQIVTKVRNLMKQAVDLIKELEEDPTSDAGLEDSLSTSVSQTASNDRRGDIIQGRGGEKPRGNERHEGPATRADSGYPSSDVESTDQDPEEGPEQSFSPTSKAAAPTAQPNDAAAESETESTNHETEDESEEEHEEQVHSTTSKDAAATAQPNDAATESETGSTNHEMEDVSNEEHEEQAHSTTSKDAAATAQPNDATTESETGSTNHEMEDVSNEEHEEQVHSTTSKDAAATAQPNDAATESETGSTNHEMEVVSDEEHEEQAQSTTSKDAAATAQPHGEATELVAQSADYVMTESAPSNPYPNTSTSYTHQDLVSHDAALNLAVESLAIDTEYDEARSMFSPAFLPDVADMIDGIHAHEKAYGPYSFEQWFDVSLLSPAPPSFSLNLDELGSKMVYKLAEISKDASVRRCGIGLVQIQGFSQAALGLSNTVAPELRTEEQHQQYNKLAPSKIPGCIVVEAPSNDDREHSPPLILPRTTPREPNREYSQADLIKVFNEICEDSTSDIHQYLIGPLPLLPGYKGLLGSGPYLPERLKKPVPGVSTSYVYASCSDKRTATALHYEDCDLHSANLLLYGEPKLWLSVEPAFNTKLEDILDRLLGAESSCAQKVRHHSVLLAPKFLDEHGIRYNILVCKPGQLVFTTPKSYHQVVNLGGNCAEAVNYMTLGCDLRLSEYQFCSKRRCNAKNYLTKDDFKTPKRRHSGGDSDVEPEAKRVYRHAALHTDSLGVFDQDLLTLNPKDDTVRGIAFYMLSRTALESLAGMVRAFRRGSRASLIGLQNPNKHGELMETSRLIDRCKDDEKLALIATRLSEWQHAMLVDKARCGGTRLLQQNVDDLESNPSTPPAVLAACKWHISHPQRSSERLMWLDWTKNRGPGILLLLPTMAQSEYGIKLHSLQKKQIIENVHKYLRPNQPAMLLMHEIREAARNVFDILTSVVDFELQSEWSDGLAPTHSSNEQFSLQERQDFIAMFRRKKYLPVNRWVGSKHTRANPQSLDSDPTLLKNPLPDECATEAPCPCVSHKLKTDKLRIGCTSNGRRTLQVYCSLQKDDWIGELTGDLLPTNHSHTNFDSMYYEMKDDTGRVTCRLYYKYDSSVVHAVSHSCRTANATLKTLREGCRARSVLVAKCQVSASDELGAELTINCLEIGGEWAKKVEKCKDCEGPCQNKIPHHPNE